ncbi:response regulator transcription factor [Actinomadura verrucosospora]|uniref:Two-component system response regulator n=1 Tax=Actinomadura verrucosospora TaxID=46165 RepID=A0A7D3ZM97_ACTVE|nr:response regulator transcription factor [Actinomadura verrucosospora]QKG23641.1 two-component system response regulator [Actinomadura verrucosospora]
MIRVLIAEDMHLLREALVELLTLEDGVDVVGQVASGPDIVPAAERHRPDVAVIDIDLPGKDGVEAAAELRDRLPECRVLILTALSRPGQLRRALAAGVAGFVPKDLRPAELVAAIRTVAAGGQAVDPELAVAALQAPPNPLTRRETEVLELVATGAEPLEIAERLFLTYGTVRNYLTSAVAKLNARNRIDAVRIAREAGWL